MRIALRMGVVERVTNQSNVEAARISFLIQDVQEASADYFRIDDAEAFIANINGELIKTHSYNNRIDVRGTVIGSGTFTDEGFLLAGINFIAPGSTVRLQSSELDVLATVTAIEKVEKSS